MEFKFPELCVELSNTYCYSRENGARQWAGYAANVAATIVVATPASVLISPRGVIILVLG
jgi:hypothetical protein